MQHLKLASKIFCVCMGPHHTARGAPLVPQLVKNLPAMRETWVQSLNWEDPLEKGKATHSSTLPGEFPGLYSPWGHKESDTTEQLSRYTALTS